MTIDNALIDQVINYWKTPWGYFFIGFCGVLFLLWLFRYRNQKPIEEIDRQIFRLIYLVSLVFDLAFLLLHFGTYAFAFGGYPLSTWHVALFTASFLGVFCVFINVVSRFYYTKGYFANTVQAASFSLTKPSDKKWVVFLLKSLMVYLFIIGIYYGAKLSLTQPPSNAEDKRIIYVTFLKLATVVGMVFGTWNLKSIYLIIKGKDDLTRHPALVGNAK